MQIKYKIIEANPNEHQIVVRFYTDAVGEKDLALESDADGTVRRARTDYAITLPIPAPTGTDLDALISSHAPKAFFAIKEAVADPAVDTSLKDIMPLIGVESVVLDTQTQTVAPNRQTISKVTIA